MTELNSADYYRRRHQQARALAAASSDPGIAEIHNDMAERYLVIILEMSEKTVTAQEADEPAEPLTISEHRD